MFHSLWAAKTDKHSLKNADTERAVGDKGSQSQNAESGRDHDVHSREHQTHDRLWVAHAHTLVDGDANFMCQVDWAYRCPG